MGLFGSRGSSGGGQAEGVRGARHSSGWVQMLKHMQTVDSLRVLDIGPTSAGNINFITGLGHSVYMANLAEDASRLEYRVTGDDGAESFDITSFLKQNLDFSGRSFDVVLLWDTVDYLPPPLVQPVIDRLHEVMDPDGRILAYFHNKPAGDETVFTRYHLSTTEDISLQRLGGRPLLATNTTRQIETLFQAFSSCKFFLAKDALREVVVTR
jgi:SAM-dependent methyltransferase